MTTLLLSLIGVFVFAIVVTAFCARKNSKKNGPEFDSEPALKINQ
ncbi:MAG: hypothetical protein K0R66_71 [Gammaproteobacteria bacterium]|jgi:hypothetical protein|nr:hypothetical protein [Gammaproteobacteria bacterium]